MKKKPNFVRKLLNQSEINMQTKKLRILVALFLAVATAGSAVAQQTDYSKRNNGIFKNLDLGVSAGTTGVGIDLSTQITGMVRVRAGVDYMPHFSASMSFGLSSFAEDGSLLDTDFSRMQRYMKKLTGFEVDDRIDMEATPRFTNFKFLVDVFPWKDKSWYFTAGFYAGPRTVVHTENTIEDSPSVVGVNIYNNMYDFFMSDDALDKPVIGSGDDAIYLDPYLVMDVRKEMEEMGYVGIHIGDYKDGRPYIMYPDKNGTVKANAFVNTIRPYLGVGFSSPMGKEGRFKLDVNAGAMFWGGSPKIVTHDGVDLADLINVRGSVRDYVDLAKTFKVFPTISIRLSYTLFSK